VLYIYNKRKAIINSSTNPKKKTEAGKIFQNLGSHLGYNLSDIIY